MKTDLQTIYKLLRKRFGHQNWWPGDTPIEVAIGAILTQNAAWKNVEKAVANLKEANALSLQALQSLPEKKLALIIRPSGYYNQKAKKLKEFSARIHKEYGGNLLNLKKKSLTEAREFLLSIKGVGKETADSILLYALEFPTFVIDAYTMRIFSRLGLFDESYDYDAAKEYFESGLKPDVALYNDYHAQLVVLGKDFCKKNNPLCWECPLARVCLSYS